MADGIKVLAGVGDSTVAPPVATDDIGGFHYQRIKAGWGVEGVFQETADVDGVRVPVGGAQVGALTETAPASDTASSGLNGRLQRIAQRITSLMALIGLRRETVIALTVGAGSNTSNTADTAGYGNMGLVVPAEFDGTQIQFNVSHDGTTWYNLYDITGAQVLMTAAAGRAYDLAGELMVWRYIRVYCTTPQATTGTVFQLVLRS